MTIECGGRRCRDHCLEEERRRHEYALGEHFEHLNRRMGMDKFLDNVYKREEAPYEKEYEPEEYR